MKHHPYQEIINLYNESKEYDLLCRGKSKTYTYYSDWEEHILACLRKFPSQKELYDFKNFCKNKERATSQSPDLFSVSVTIFLSTYLAQVLQYLDEANKSIAYKFIIWIPVCIVGILMFADTMHTFRRGNYFYADMIKLIEKVEGDEIQTVPTALPCEALRKEQMQQMEDIKIPWYKKAKNWIYKNAINIFHWFVIICLTAYVLAHWTACISMQFFNSFDGNNILFIAWLILIFLMIYDIEGKGFKISRHKQKEIQEKMDEINQLYNLETMSRQIDDMTASESTESQSQEEGDK